jgi:hypothetical protein
MASVFMVGPKWWQRIANQGFDARGLGPVKQPPAAASKVEHVPLTHRIPRWLFPRSSGAHLIVATHVSGGYLPKLDYQTVYDRAAAK